MPSSTAAWVIWLDIGRFIVDWKIIEFCMVDVLTINSIRPNNYNIYGHYQDINMAWHSHMTNVTVNELITNS